jgi:peptide/nickel transport system permease protein
MRRLAYLVVVLAGMTFLIFMMSTVAPEDPARSALGPYAPEEAVQMYRREHGLNEPILVQYWIYMNRLVRGDLGLSVLTSRPVAEEFGRALPATIELVLPSLILAVVGGVILGTIAATKRNAWPDSVARLVSIFGMSMPIFWFGLVLQLIFFLWLGWLPVGRRLPAATFNTPGPTGLLTVDSLLAGDLGLFITAVRHLILPVLAISVVNLAEMTRMTRSVLVDVLNQDYIRTAHSKGLRLRVVLLRHAMRNALIPLVTVFGFMLGRAVGGSVIVETIFTWPGVGRQAIDALIRLDLPMVTAFALMMATAFGVINLIVDLSYAAIDPRIRRR